ncbi:MAG: Gfo/Idh/MocA family oxidoreductase [Verrucomicrobiota bacterium]
MKLILRFASVVLFAGCIQAAEEEIDIGFVIEPTASHISGYLEVLVERTGVRSVAVAVPDEGALANTKEKLGDRFYGDGFASAEEMLAEVRPALTVVTMEGVNAPAVIKAALDAGSHVLTEKPSCVKLSHFEELAKLAEARDRHLMLAMATRSGSPLKKARQLIADGAIGKPYSVSMIWIADQTRLTKPAYHESWLADPKRAGGGKLIYHGVHYLDVIQQLLDEPIVEISGFTNNVGGQPIGVEDSAVVSFKFESGVTGVHNTGYYLNRGKQSEIRIWGSDGWLRLAHLEGEPLEWLSTKGDRPNLVQTFEYDDRLLMYHQFFQEAIDAIRTDGEPPISTAESLRALRVVFAAYEAVETGKTQKIPINP